MRVHGRAQRTIWLAEDGRAVEVIDQTGLPHELRFVRLESVMDAARAIADMVVRGAPLIGATAAYGMCLALTRDPGDAALQAARELLLATRPTAINLRWALDQIAGAVQSLAPSRRAEAAYRRAAAICDEDVATNSAIGEHGRRLIEAAWQEGHRQRPVQILTHCNAGWLAAVDWGTALAPVYKAHEAGIPVHVFVDETRPRNQGAALTAWELGQQAVPHTVVVDSASGYLLQQGRIDLCLVGCDRVTARGDVCNKIGTYLKALAARAEEVPFYVAVPGPSIDWSIEDGRRDIPIEERSGDEVRWMRGRTVEGHPAAVTSLPEQSPVANPAFDVTPADLIAAVITERGVGPASREGLRALYPELSAVIAEPDGAAI
jgi:methylthioribose-1-phosphate isomerase